MKKHIITSLLFFIPLVAGADDHCTNPDKYTVDKRCYVTEEQKTQKPYNSVVLVPREKGIDCTGVIVKEGDNYYVYTAKHCIRKRIFDRGAQSLDFSDIEFLTVKTQDNTEHKVRKHKVYLDKDFAVYRFNNINDSVKKIAATKTDKETLENAVWEVQVLGYGALKIMSDKEIEDFKQDYKKALGDEGFYQDDGVDVSKYFKNISFFGDKWKYLTEDNDKLKESVCDYYAKYGGDGCQGWQGNSGGPIFDKDGKVMAIVTMGWDFVGGERHARIAGGKPNTENAGSVSFLKEE